MVNTVVDTADTRFSLRLSSSLFIFPCFLCPLFSPSPIFIAIARIDRAAYRSAVSGNGGKIGQRAEKYIVRVYCERLLRIHQCTMESGNKTGKKGVSRVARNSACN